MSVSTVDGSVEAAELKRSRGGLSIFSNIRFRLADGTTKTITKAVAKDSVAERLKPGSSGRFYLFNGFDLKGVHGVRTSDGQSLYEFPTSNAKLFLVLGIINLVWIVFKLAVDGEIPLLAVALIILAIVGYTLMSKTAREAKQQFDQDSGGLVPPVQAGETPA